MAIVQETLVSNDHRREALAQQWDGPTFWSLAIGRQGGVVILCSPGQRENVSIWQKDPEGRLLSLLISFNDIKVNVYAPTNPTERGVFLKSLQPYLFPNSHLLLAGDFNCYDGALDKMGGSVSIDARLSDLKSVDFVRDAWRFKHPKERQFTWYNSDFSIASRLDSFLITRILCDRVSSCEIRPCVYSDHDFNFFCWIWICIRQSSGALEFGNLIIHYCKMKIFVPQNLILLSLFCFHDRPFRRIWLCGIV